MESHKLCIMLHRVFTAAQGGGTLVDCVRIWVSAGNGAAGEPAYGGKGGRGGNVYVRADSRVGDGTRGLGRLANENPALRFLAQNGYPSRYTIYTHTFAIYHIMSENFS